MSLIELIITIAVIGLILWVINTLIPMDSRIKQVLNVVVILALVIWIASVFLGASTLRIG